jgi:acyl-CoA reductase-like NAD-dependent aldehyde dehydrogenase
VLAITPSTYPGLLAIHKIAPALAAGNAVVLKPAELTPLTALARADCFLEAGLPGAVPSVVTGHGGEIGDAFVADPRIRKVSFTGSTAVGERISLAPQLSPPAATPTPARSASPCSGSSFIPR